ncbi:tRNA-splicing endonuclease subunit Sen34 [Leptopilina boulardi]|uniref:tRNA-splicing endonuclease subunit Sen34 n=1 Tax=Leptopilina boulardi TaxID=63433 RepID=UPI0021F51034|nr:tRNA-splicing endonuclease subunit Sen34 [Leptopilina boulardi]
MSNPIKLAFSNDNILVWNANDWLKLRQDYRIIGDLIGCLPKLPRQNILSGLPLSLLPEEAKLLMDKGVARLVHYPCMKQKPSDDLEKLFLEFREKLFLEQEVCLRKEKEKQVICMMDKIVEGKRRKILGVETSKKKMRKPLDEETKKKLETIEIDRQKLFDKEMAKLPKLKKEDALIQTHTEYPWATEEDAKDVDWNYPNTQEEKLRYNVFKDLWEKNFYITSGVKFGSDFLAYPGDPIMFHSQFIIHCKEKTDVLSVNELVSICRIGSSVRKTQVFASFSEENDKIEYQSFQWAESNAF